MSEDATFTTRQIADACGVSTQAILKQLDKLGLRSGCRKVGNRLLISTTTATAICSHYGVSVVDGCQLQQPNQQPKQPTERQETAALIEQLRVKDEQIKAMQRTIDSLTDSLKASQALHGADIKEKLLDEQSQDEDTGQPKPKSWLSRLLRR